MRKAIDGYNAYRFFGFFPIIDVVDLEGVFYDTVSWPTGIFEWLQGIRHSHLVYCTGDVYELIPYFPSHFARQFSAMTDLAHQGSLINGAKA